MDGMVEKKVLSGLLEETELDTGVLEKIGFASRAFDIFRVFNVVLFGKSEYEDYFCLAYLAASLCACDRETEAEDACETIALCLKLSCGKQNKKIREEN